MSTRHSIRPHGSSAYVPHAPLARSARATYPTFLPLPDTLHLQLSWALRGLADGFRWDTVIQLAYNDPEVRSNVFKSLMLNSVSLTSIYTFDLLLHPLVKDQQKWFHRNLGWFYQVLWLLPVVGVSFYLNGSWCTLIAKRTYALHHGRASQQQNVTYAGIITALATSAYRAVMVLTSVVVSFALGAVPLVGPPLGFIFMCWVDAYYCFEFIWEARGMSLARRVRHLEERWAYYFCFGLPSAALCMWGSGLANAALFALMFPAYIIMAMHARPVPADPYAPVPPTASGEPIRPSPFVPIRIPVFALVIWLNERIVGLLSVGGRRGGRHTRANSESAESMEAGDTIELDALGGRGGRPTTGSLGRRKLD